MTHSHTPAPAGEKRHVAVSDSMVEAAMSVPPIPGRGPNVFDDGRMSAALTAALTAEPGEAVAPKEAFYAGFGAGEANGKFDDDNVDDAWSRYLAHPHPYPLPLKEEVERVLEPFAEAWNVATHHKDLVAKLSMAQLGELAAHEVSGVHFRNADALLSRLRAGAQEGWRTDWFCRNCGWTGKEPEATRHMYPRQGAGGYTAACCPSCGHHFNEHEIARYAAPSPEEGGRS